MSKRILEYFVVTADSPRELANYVNQYLAEGWTLTGVMVHAEGQYHQAVVYMSEEKR